MLDIIQAIPFSFAALFPVLNPLGCALIFVSLTRGIPADQLPKLALQVAMNTFFMLAAVLLTGSYILSFFGITIPIVQVGGGLLLAYIGWQIMNQSSVSDKNTTSTSKDPAEIAFFPLTMPITAGPGCIAVTLTIGAHEMTHVDLFGEIGALIGILLASIMVFLCYRYASSVTKIFGKTGSEVIMRLAAFINLCLGLEIMWRGITTLAHQLMA